MAINIVQQVQLINFPFQKKGRIERSLHLNNIVEII